jgi:hypothetical protein
MSKPCDRLCKCGNPVEVIDDWFSHQCVECNDRSIERYNRLREWHHYHPDEPCPKSELE